MTTAVPDSALLAAARACPSGWAYVTTRGKAKLPPHVRLMDQKLCDLEARRTRLLIIEMPPRHGKSYTSTEKMASWYLGRHPHHRVGIIGYGAKLATDFGRKNRNDMEEWGERVFGLRVDPRSSAMDDWKIHGHGGGLISVGLTGTLTGKGLDLLIIDDPIKNQIEAHSETYRERLWGLWLSTARTRLEPGGVVLLIQTRWHEDDLAGRLQANPPQGWVVDVLRLPALAEKDDPLGRAEGEPLWPERYSLEELESIRHGNSYVWNALYQQRPVAAEGNLLKSAWWRTYTDDPRIIAARADEVIQSWDMAFKDTDDSDYVVGQVWARIGADRFLLHQVRDRMDFPTTVRAVLAMSTSWPMATVKLVEDKANGPAVIAELKSTLEGLIPVEPQGGKIARAVAVSPIVESGNVYLPDRAAAPWVGDFYSETAAFPNGAHDDQVDAATQALIRLKDSTEPAAAANPFGGTGHGSTAGAAGRKERRRRDRLEEYFADDADSDEDDD